MTVAYESSEYHAAQLSSPRDWLTMTKPGVLMLVVFSGAAGMWMAPGETNLFLQAVIVLSIAMGSAAGGMLNMVYDRDIDAIMKRTQTRPIVRGAIASDDAQVLGLALAIFSVALLGLASNWQAAAWLAFAIFFYAVIYTRWLKRHTPQNIVIGGAAGAFPPVIGWLAVTGGAHAMLPWLLFAVVFLWTPPHFWALALFRNEDYRRAQVPMMPVVAGEKSTSLQMLVYTLLLLPVTLAPLAIASTLGWFYGVAAGALGARFIAYAWKVYRTLDDKKARAMFGFSILYLAGIFAAMLIDHALI